MARFVPRSLRGQRQEAGAEEAAQRQDGDPVTDDQTSDREDRTGSAESDAAEPKRPVRARKTTKFRRPRPRKPGTADRTGSDAGDAAGSAKQASDEAERLARRDEELDARHEESEEATGGSAARTQRASADDEDAAVVAEQERDRADQDANQDADQDTDHDADQGDDRDGDQDTDRDADQDDEQAEDSTDEQDSADESDESDGERTTRSRRTGSSSAARAGGLSRTKRKSSSGSVRSKTKERSGRSERGRGGRKVVSPPRTGSNRRQRAAEAAISRLRRTALNLSVWTVVVALAAGGAWYWLYQGEVHETAGEEASAAAIAAAESIFSYDYRAFDESVSNGDDFVTGKFKDEYKKTTANLKKSVKKEKAIVRAKVSVASVTEVSPTRVEVLLFVNQYRRNVNISGEKVDENRVLLTMVYVEGKDGEGSWLVSDAAAI